MFPLRKVYDGASSRPPGWGWLGWREQYRGRATKSLLLSCSFTVAGLLHKDVIQHWQWFLPTSASAVSRCPSEPSLPEGLRASLLFLRLRVGFCPSIEPLRPSAGIWQGRLSPSRVSVVKKTPKPQPEAPAEKHPCLEVSSKWLPDKGIFGSFELKGTINKRYYRLTSSQLQTGVGKNILASSF